MSAPLYLEGGQGCQVSWEEPALKCVLPHKAEQYFPLTRVSRVIVMGYCEFETKALLACADYGVTLVFLDERGEVRARLLGKGGERQSFIQRLLDLLASSDGHERYAAWLAAMEKMAVRSTARRLKVADWQVVTVPALRLAVAEDGLFQRGLWRGMLYSQVLAVLMSMGLDAKSELLQSVRLDLTNDLTRLISWDFVAPLAELQQQGGCPNNNKAWLAFYQARSERVDALLKATLNRLHIWLVELF